MSYTEFTKLRALRIFTSYLHLRMRGVCYACLLLPNFQIWRVFLPYVPYLCIPQTLLKRLVGLICTSWNLFKGLVWKMVNTGPKKILCDPFSKIGVFDFLISWIFRKKTKKYKNSWLLVSSRCFCFAFHANLMSTGKKERLKFLFITPIILLINMPISLFGWTV